MTKKYTVQIEIPVPAYRRYAIPVEAATPEEAEATAMQMMHGDPEIETYFTEESISDDAYDYDEAEIVFTDEVTV